MLCGRMTPTQRELAKRKCKLDSEKYMKLLNWLIQNHPSYSDVIPPEQAPSPDLVSGFSSTQNNTGTMSGGQPLGRNTCKMVKEVGVDCGIVDIAKFMPHVFRLKFLRCLQTICLLIWLR